MADDTYPVVLADILTLPAGRRRDVLALKAVALLRGEPVTRNLAAHGVRTGDDALRDLIARDEDGPAQGRIGPVEPAHPADAGPEPVSLRAFAADRAERRTRLASEALLRARDEAECGRFREAAVEIAIFLDTEPNAPREALVAEMGALAEREPYARACYGEALVRGDGVARDVEAGLAHLRAAEEGDDAEAAAWAAFWLGDHYEFRPGESRRALRHYEAAARYGHEPGAFNAGLIHQVGRPGIPVDKAKAAAFYRIGADLGGRQSRTCLAVLIAKGHAEAHPGEDWRAMLRRGAAEGDHVAAGFLHLVGEIEATGPDDLARRLRALEEEAVPESSGDRVDHVLASLVGAA